MGIRQLRGLAATITLIRAVSQLPDRGMAAIDLDGDENRAIGSGAGR